MNDTIGVILLDGNEIILQVYSLDTHQQWVQSLSQYYDLAPTIQSKHATSSEIVEIIAGVFLTKYANVIYDWKICARNLQEETVHDISDATGLSIDSLTLKKEQELLCKGILMDMD